MATGKSQEKISPADSSKEPPITTSRITPEIHVFYELPGKTRGTEGSLYVRWAGVKSFVEDGEIYCIAQRPDCRLLLAEAISAVAC